jgi:capsular exopolysaccharide synthesis family protein
LEPGQSEEGLIDKLRILWQKKWLISSIVLVFCFGIALLTYRTKPIYRATTLLQIERRSATIVNIEDVYREEAPWYRFNETQSKLIGSRRICQKALSRIDLSQTEKYKSISDLAAVVQSKLTIEPLEDTFLVNVSYEDEDPALAAAVVNAVTDAYIEDAVSQRRELSEEAEQKIKKQLPILREKLQESEKALQDFKDENSTTALEKQQENTFTRLAAQRTRLDDAREQRVKLEAVLANIKKASNKTSSLLAVPAIAQDNTVVSYLQAKSALEREKADLLQGLKEYHPQVAALNKKIEELANQIDERARLIAESIESDHQEKKYLEESLSASVAAIQQEAEKLDRISNRHQYLSGQVEANRKLYEEFLQRQKELESSPNVDVGTVRIIDRAKVPTSPVKPKKVQNMLIALVLSLIGGIAFSLLLDHLDDTLKTNEEAEKFLSLPILGVVPFIREKRGNTDRIELTAHRDPRASFTEAYRAIRTSLTFSATDQAPKAYLVTSAGEKEGKTITAASLSIVTAHQGKKVLLIDSDLRKPRIHQVFQIDNSSGLTNYLAGMSELDAIIHKTEVDNLDVIGSGPISPNPSELLGSAKMRELITAVKERYDVIFMDSPPVVPVADARVLAPLADSVIQVAWTGRMSRKVIMMGKQLLSSVGAKIVGLVLNRVGRRGSGRYYYYHRYYYYRESSDRKEE